ncbi:MAG: prolipoprotein diacylglyceryl transferase [Verrucomicrobiae bacterium]|nr:prolipoprotein diacylglyceryl transferase [Verrucomicrobiae bacterium]
MDPVVIRFGPLTVHWYGVFIVLAMVLGIYLAARRGLRERVEPEVFYDLLPWIIVGGVAGARLLFVVTYWEQNFSGRPWWHVVAVWEGGLVFHGGLAGAAVAVVGFARRRRLPLWVLADALAPSLAAGHVLGRMGCLMNGCCYGRPTAVAWAVRFPLEHETHGVAVHPTQLYEAGLNLCLYLGLAALYRRKQFDGQVFAAYLIGYAVLRAGVEFFRGDYPNVVGGWMTPGHWTSLVVLGVGVGLYYRLPRVLARRGGPGAEG